MDEISARVDSILRWANTPCLFLALVVVGTLLIFLGRKIGPWPKTRKAQLDAFVGFLASGGILTTALTLQQHGAQKESSRYRAEAAHAYGDARSTLEGLAEMKPCGKGEPVTRDGEPQEIEKLCKWAGLVIGKAQLGMPATDPDSVGWLPKRMPAACGNLLAVPRLTEIPERPWLRDPELNRHLEAVEGAFHAYSRQHIKECAAVQREKDADPADLSKWGSW
jgi:hypothetical protein